MDGYSEKITKAFFKKASLVTFLAVPLVALLCALAFLIDFRLNAQSTGSMIGESAGTITGRAVGSFQGFTEGQREGYAAGKEAGLSAEDTIAELSGKIQESGKLRVLVASGKYSDVLSIGEDKDLSYVALLSQKYHAVFTVDLSSAEITLEDDGLHIHLGDPGLEFIPDGNPQKLAEYQKGKYTGSAEAGDAAGINSINQIRTKATEQLSKDGSLMKAARASAQNQITQLVKAVSLSNPKVFVEFQGGENQ